MSGLERAAALGTLVKNLDLYEVRRAEGPERVAMEWWRAEGLTRDYFRVEDEAGLRFWLYRDGLYDREIEQEEGRVVLPNWYMHGLFA